MIEQTRRPWLALAVLCLGTFAVLLDATIVNVALPSLITGLHASLDQALWVVNAYLLVFAALLILAGRLGDLFGPRRLFTVGLAVFAVASAACGAAASPGQLIAALAPRLNNLTHDVFARAYITAMHPTLAISVALLIAGALVCLLLRRTPAPAPPLRAAPPPARHRQAEKSLARGHRQ